MIFLIVQFPFAESLTYLAKHSALVASALTNKNEKNINSLRDRKIENVNRDTINLIKVKKVTVLLYHSIWGEILLSKYVFDVLKIHI